MRPAYEVIHWNGADARTWIWSCAAGRSRSWNQLAAERLVPLEELRAWLLPRPGLVEEVAAEFRVTDRYAVSR